MKIGDKILIVVGALFFIMLIGFFIATYIEELNMDSDNNIILVQTNNYRLE